MLTPPLNYLYYIEWHLLYLYYTFFKNYPIAELIYLPISLNETTLFLGSTKKTDKNSLIEQTKQVNNTFVFKNYPLEELRYLWIWLNMTKLFLCSTKRSDWNRGNEQNTQRKRLKRVRSIILYLSLMAISCGKVLTQNLMFYHIFPSPKMKWSMIISNKHGRHMLPHELLNHLWLQIFSKIRK